VGERVVVVVPGMMGSRLAWRGRTIWPAPVADFVFGYPHLELLLQDDVEAVGLVERYGLLPFYDVLLDDLERWGFVRGDTLVTVPYDWRRSHEHGAGTLADALDAIAARRPDAEITLLGHSMGGMLSRIVLESGLYEDRPGRRLVREVYFLGTPHRGVVNIFPGLMGRKGILWLSAAQAYRIACDPRFPASYELLPPPSMPWAFRGDEATWPTVDIYRDKALAAGLGLVRHNLEAALAFHARMAEGRRPRDVRYVAFQGTWHRTATGISVTGPREASSWTADNGGDGSVPVWSSTLPDVQSLAVGGEHWTIYKDATLKRALATLLGTRPSMGAAPVELSLPSRAARPARQLTVALSLPAAADHPGFLRFEREDAAGLVPVGPEVPIRPPAGLPRARLSVHLRAPEAAGSYRLSYYRDGDETPADSDPLLVRAED
jgi:hypothetical protein